MKSKKSLTPHPSPRAPRHVCVLGDGGWGTALAVQLAGRGHTVRLWGAFPGYVEEVARRRVNRKFLPGVRIPREVRLTPSLAEAVAGTGLVVSVVPTQYLDGVLARLSSEARLSPRVPFVSASKGIDTRTLERCSEIIRRRFPANPVCVLTGPSHAEEVARGLPATVLAASRDARLARLVQRTLGGGALRVYTGRDPVGAELGGALKNVIALAAGISDGLALGDNAKAALLSRGLVEIARLGVALGARADTFWGISGLGDLLTTAYSPHGRNLRVGRQLGAGKSLRRILAGMEQVAEGVPTAAACRVLARRHRVEMPITEEICRILYGGKSPRKAVADLLNRSPKEE